MAAHHRVLVDRQPVVGLGALEVQQPHPHAPSLAPLEDFHLDPVHQHPVEGPVGAHQRGTPGLGYLAESLLEGLAGQAGVEPLYGLPQPPGQQYLAVVFALRAQLAGGDGRAEEHGVPQGAEPLEGGLLDCGLFKICHGLDIL